MIGYFKKRRLKRKQEEARYQEWAIAIQEEMVKEIIEILNEDPEYKKFRLTPRLKKYIAEKIITKVVAERL